MRRECSNYTEKNSDTPETKV